MYLGQLVDGPPAVECFRRGVALMEKEAQAAAACVACPARSPRSLLPRNSLSPFHRPASSAAGRAAPRRAVTRRDRAPS